MITRRLVSLLLVAPLVLGACSGGKDTDGEASPTTTLRAKQWTDLATDAFGPMTSTSVELPAHGEAWLAGDLSTEEYRRKLRFALVDASETKDLVLALPPHDGKERYEASVDLYLRHVSVHIAAVNMEPGRERDQAVLLARRLRELSDRVFDRGESKVDSTAAGDTSDAASDAPDDVPDWVAEGLAVGPPLDDAPPPAANTPPPRDVTRTTQPAADWEAAVKAAGAPDRLDDVGDLAAQARAYVKAAEVLRDEPVPAGEDGRERSVILRLGYLIKADAARAAQLGLVPIAHDLARIDLDPS